MTRRNQAIMRLLLAIAVCGALCATGHAQTPGDPHNWDVGGIRLGISVEQAQAALHAHDPSMKVQVLQSPSQVGKGTFTSVVVGATGAQGIAEPKKSDAILIAFTETEGNKAYSITRVLTYDQSSSPPTDVLIRQLIEKYGKPHLSTCTPGRPCGSSNDPQGLTLRGSPLIQAPFYHAIFWNFGPDGQRVNADACASAYGAPIGDVAFKDLGQGFGFSFPTASHELPENHCGIGLAVNLNESLSAAFEVQQMLVDAQLQYRDLTNIDKIHKDADAKRLEDLKAKAEQKSPF
jgi:hypothetical protein